MSFEVPKQLLDGVVQAFDPVEVWLFGSKARGDWHQDSDIDLFVVVDDDLTGKLEPGKALSAARGGYKGPVDFLVTTLSSHQARRTVVGTLDEIVAGEGRRVYARG
jgi:predicted nucleotidyltransferase